jgi:protein-disulfide isomerase
MHDLLYENQDGLGESLYTEFARKLSLSPEALRKALENQEYKGRVRADFNGGVRSGVNGTPTFFINGRRHDGAYNFQDLPRAIEAPVGSAKGAAKR